MYYNGANNAEFTINGSGSFETTYIQSPTTNVGALRLETDKSYSLVGYSYMEFTIYYPTAVTSQGTIEIWRREYDTDTYGLLKRIYRANIYDSCEANSTKVYKISLSDCQTTCSTGIRIIFSASNYGCQVKRIRLI